MNVKKLFRHILGFAFGGTLFAILIPLGLWSLSRAVDRWLSLPTFGESIWRYFIAVPIGAIGLVFVFWSNLFLVTRGKGGPAEGFGMAISPRSERLVTTGPYRWSRNPMVFGALTCYTALSFLWGTIGGLLIIAVFIPFAILYIKRFEETRLLRDFGKEYVAYKKRASMLVPWPKGG